MNENPQRVTSVASLLLLLASVMWGVVNIRGNLGSSRPPQAETIPYKPAGSQARLARLWQDPFQVFQQASGTSAHSPPGSEESLAAQIERRRGSVAIIGVMLEGTPYEADAETRRRLRYAVEEALLTSDLVPESRNLIGVTTLPLNRTKPPFETEVPFEWFAAAPAPTSVSLDHVLVLWLREDDFAARPLPRLGELLKSFLDPDGTGSDHEPDVFVIGPRSSDTLRAMADSDTEPDKDNFCATLAKKGHFKILSPEATAPDEFLRPGGECQAAGGARALSAERPVIRDLIEKSLQTPAATDVDACPGCVFENWIATDYQLAKTLAAELENRRDDKSEQGNVVVLVSEADTFYGRSLPEAVDKALNPCTRGPWETWHFDYLRGLEGQKATNAGPETSQRKIPDSPEAILEATLRRTGETAEGEAQLDYAARLADFLRSEDRRRRASGDGRIFAVGLTGSDVYDKLVLLRALRSHLPEALFFTTDLDASLWQPQELTYTRNLLVASAYPLEPSPGTDQFLPFRDSYQTAVFSATRGAVARARGISDGTARPATPLTGKLYEIGRQGPVALPQPMPKDPNPRAAWLKLNWTIKECAVMLGLLGLLGLILVLRGGFESRPDRGAAQGGGGSADRDRRPPVATLPWALLVIALLSWGAKLAYTISQRPGEEIWSLTDGISIWATEGIRALEILLGVSVLVVVARQYRRHCEDLRNDYFAAEPLTHEPTGEADHHARHGVAARLRGAWIFFKSIQVNSWSPQVNMGEIEARQVFEGYLHRGKMRHRYLRIVPQVAVYFLGVVALMSLIGDAPDRLCIRGPMSRNFDRGMLLTSVFLFLLVLFYVLDAARLTGKMLESLARYHTRWPENLVGQWATRLCVRPRDLDGWLDVRFAAYKTQETGRLMMYPFILYLLLLFARHSFFENWTWPWSLIAIFTGNFLLAATCWAFVRRAARSVRKETLDRFDRATALVAAESLATVVTPGSAEEAGAEAACKVCTYSKDNYVKRLGDLRAEIEGERRGAFSNVIQDPTVLALFIPTGVTGILTVALYYLFDGH